MQRITLIGRLGGDPEMRYTPDGVPVANFSLAVSEVISKTGRDGNARQCPLGWKESYNGKNWELTRWYRISVWRGLAETCNQYLSKGREVFVEGVLGGEAADGVMEPRVFESGGKHRASYEVTARTVKFLGGASDNGGGAPAPKEPPPQKEDW